MKSLIFCLCSLLSMSVLASDSKLLENEKNTIEIYQKHAKYVVFVHKHQRVMNRSMQVFEMPSGSGSGFIWNDQGYVVTNYHVIKDSKYITVNFDGIISKAKVIGAEPRKDIAVLKITSNQALKKIKRMPPLFLTKSSNLQVGQKSIAIGNPFGLDHSLSTGVISALGRKVPGEKVTLRDMIQTDAAINPGNSGGPLFDSQGQLIGMNTAIYSKSGASAGIGFAVPAEDIYRAVNQIIKSGYVILAGIGVERIEPSIARQLGVSKGVLVGQVIQGAPAEKARLQGTYRDEYGNIHLGDIITHINRQPVNNYDDMYHIMSEVKIGSSVTLTLLNHSKVRTVRVKTINISTL